MEHLILFYFIEMLPRTVSKTFGSSTMVVTQGAFDVVTHCLQLGISKAHKTNLSDNCHFFFQKLMNLH